jgi:CRISPR/Cas system CMR-associated protein Cmr5 small subunit
MKNLEQIRAANALTYAESDAKKTNSDGGNVVKKLPALIMQNGLLAATAFSYQKQADEMSRQWKSFRKKNNRPPTPEEEARFEDNGFYTCFDFLVRHIRNKQIDIIPESFIPKTTSGPKLRQLDVLLGFLTSPESSSEILKLATEESLAWLSYARRFVRKDTDIQDDDDPTN